MVDRFLNFISEEKLFQTGSKILLAVSGGVDSCVMAELFHRSGFSFGLAHCNFQLRGAESDRDEQFVRKLAEKYDVPIFVSHFETSAFAKKNRLSVQMAARDFRYQWFEEILTKESYECVATAHHLDDQMETFFINLARGTGIAGLHGILPKQGRIIRPMLFASRKDIEKFAIENKLEFTEDSSNSSLKYTRNRIRIKIIPQFEKINPSFREQMGITINKLKDAEAIYNSIVEREKERLVLKHGQGFKLPIAELKKLTPGRTWLYELISGFNFTPSVVNDIYSSLDKQPGKIFHSPSHRLVKDRDFLFISLQPPGTSESKFEVYPETPNDLPVNLKFTKQVRMPEDLKAGADNALLDFDRLRFPLTLRKWQKGDYFYPMGMKGRKMLSDFFTDNKYSLLQKEHTWLLCSGADIAWIVGVRPDDRFKITAQTKTILQVRLFL